MAVEVRELSASQLGRAVGLSTARIRQLALKGDLPYRDTPLGRLFEPRCVEIIEDARLEAEITRRRK